MYKLSVGYAPAGVPHSFTRFFVLSPGFFQQVAGRELPGYVASAVQNVFVHVDENQYGSVY